MSTAPKLWTIGSMLTWTEQFFAEKGVDTPRLDAEVLLSHMLEKDRIYCYSHYDEPLETAELARFRELVKGRVSGKSVAGLIGQKEFMGLLFKVNEHVLIPRPDTETLVDGVLSLLDRKKSYRILDMCTGTGAILLSLLHYMKESEGVGVDISKEALAVAKLNQKVLALEERSTLVESDLFTNLNGYEGTFDVLVSNPPYIPTEEMKTLAPEVLAEPHIALHGGADGLDFYRKLLQEAPKYVRSGGYVGFEIGYNQADALRALGQTYACYGDMIEKRDLAGFVRAVFFQVGKHEDENL